MLNGSFLKNTAKHGELARRIWFLLLALLVYRIGTHIPVPGINLSELSAIFHSKTSIFNLFNLFSGGALSRSSIFALGIAPYISASIIMQLMSYALPAIEALRKEGESGRRKITQYTRYGTLFLAIIESWIIIISLESSPRLVADPGLSFRIIALVSLVSGSMFLMWLGEQITERGLGNGISILIFAGIVSGFPSALGSLLDLVSNRTDAGAVFVPLSVIFLVILVTFLVVFIERGQRKILVNYAKRQVGNRVYQAASSHLPLKINTAGVMPPILAQSVILFPATLVGFVAVGDAANFFKDIGAALSPGQPIYVFLFAGAIVFFSFFYTALAFNSREVADNLKKSGAFVPGIRPGDHTAKYIDKVLSRLTLCGAFYVTLICLIPEFLVVQYKVSFSFGGTSLLIIVVVTMDFWAQIQSFLMSQKYESLLKKANFKTGADR